jgi:cytochrome c oxidase subunit 2
LDRFVIPGNCDRLVCRYISAAYDEETERIMSFSTKIAAIGAGITSVAGFSAAAVASQPVPWQTGFQDAVTPVMEQINDFHNLLLVIITVITIFVTALMIYVMWRFSEKNNPEPSRTTHNTLLEVIWTAVPVMILVVIAVPSLKLLYLEDKAPNAEMTLKITANQFYWNYEYPDQGGISFDATMVAEEDLKEGQPRLLTTDETVVVPVDTEIRVLLAAADVIHAWAMPAFGVKTDAVPGRLNETWFKATKTGTYYGQCSELCGSNHGFMPIQVKVVSKEDFAKWVVKAKVEYASDDQPEAGVKVATITKN